MYLCNASCTSCPFPAAVFTDRLLPLTCGTGGCRSTKKSTGISRHHEIKMLHSPHRAMSPSVPHRWRGTSSREVCQGGHFFCTGLLAHVSRITAFISGNRYISEKYIAKQSGNALNCRAAIRRGWRLSPGTDLPGKRLSWRQAWAGAGVPHSYQIPHLYPLHLEASRV